MISTSLLHKVVFNTPQKGGVMDVKCHHVEVSRLLLNGNQYPVIELHFTEKIKWEVNPLHIDHIYPISV